jgi:hypothetical protein
MQRDNWDCNQYSQDTDTEDVPDARRVDMVIRSTAVVLRTIDSGSSNPRRLLISYPYLSGIVSAEFVCYMARGSMGDIVYLWCKTMVHRRVETTESHFEA